MRVLNGPRSGFALIELAIVIIVVSIVIAGIAGGKSLIDQARLRSVISEMDEFNTAYRNFKDRYQAIPGDMNNAYDIWGVKCTSGTDADCNGNGNSIIEYANDSSNEVNKAWKHLGLAGMLGFELSGDPALNGGGDVTIGEQIPYSKISGAGYLFQGPLSPDTAMFGTTTNGLLLGSGGGAGSNLNAGALSPLDAFTIDQKVDDGNYDADGNAIGGTTGTTRAFDPSGDTTDCIDASTGLYNIANELPTCMLGFAADQQPGIMTYFGAIASSGQSGGGGPGGGSGGLVGCNSTNSCGVPASLQAILGSSTISCTPNPNGAQFYVNCNGGYSAFALYSTDGNSLSNNIFLQDGSNIHIWSINPDGTAGPVTTYSTTPGNPNYLNCNNWYYSGQGCTTDVVNEPCIWNPSVTCSSPAPGATYVPGTVLYGNVNPF